MKILLSSAGRRGALLKCIKASGGNGSTANTVTACDVSDYSAAFWMADERFLAPRCTAPDFIEAVTRECRMRAVELIIPTIDTELAIYARSAPQLREANVEVAISSPETVEICLDKKRTHEWLCAHGFPTVRQVSAQALLADPLALRYPLIAKPRFGSASIGLLRLAEPKAAALIPENADYVVQEIASGTEYTVNLYVNRQGKCIEAVPHRRIEVRSGEVSKAITRKDPAIIDLAARIAESLPGGWGSMNIQGFVDDSGQMRIIEINSRFGGGYPVAFQAGADFISYLTDETQGKSTRQDLNTSWQDGLLMLRYDEAVFRVVE